MSSTYIVMFSLMCLLFGSSMTMGVALILHPKRMTGSLALITVILLSATFFTAVFVMFMALSGHRLGCWPPIRMMEPVNV